MSDQAVIDRLVAVPDRLWEDGCPVAGGGRGTAELALRRWRSFGRRAKRRRPTSEGRVEDLAQGLRDGLEPDPALVGPLMEEYRHLARELAAVLRSYPASVSRE